MRVLAGRLAAKVPALAREHAARDGSTRPGRLSMAGNGALRGRDLLAAEAQRVVTERAEVVRW